MYASKKDLGFAIQNTIEAAKKCPSTSDMVRIVFVHKENSRRHYVGFQYSKPDIKISDIISYDDGTVSGSTAEVVSVID